MSQTAYAKSPSAMFSAVASDAKATAALQSVAKDQVIIAAEASAATAATNGGDSTRNAFKSRGCPPRSRT